MVTVKCFFSLWDYNRIPDQWTKVAIPPQELFRTVVDSTVKEVKWLPQTLFDGIEVQYVFDNREDATVFLQNLPEDFKHSNPRLVK